MKKAHGMQKNMEKSNVKNQEQKIEIP